MTIQNTRRDILRGSLAVAGLSVLGIPEWALPALAQGETVVPFTDIPDNLRCEPPPDRRLLDIRTIDGPFTPKDKFATTQHYGHPDVDPATFKLKVSGLVNRPKSLSLDELKKMGGTELVAGFECSGNRGPLQGLSRQRQVDRRAAEDRARRGRREGRRRASSCSSAPITARKKSSGARRSSRSTSSSAAACTREKALSRRAVPRLGAERRAADQASGRAAAADRAGLVRRRQREVALADPRAGRARTSASTRRAGTARCAAR